MFTFGKSRFADNLPNKFWVRGDKVVAVACGDEHTALITSNLFRNKARVFVLVAEQPPRWRMLFEIEKQRR